MKSVRIRPKICSAFQPKSAEDVPSAIKLMIEENAAKSSCFFSQRKLQTKSSAILRGHLPKGRKSI